MKQIVCEMCEGTDFVKDEGVFVCQSCGTKYSVEEAKKLMVEAVAVSPAAGTGTSAGAGAGTASGQVQNYLVLANNASSSNNNKEAEEYANRVIELDPLNAEAWLIKGKAAGWQSTIAKNRFSESIDCWSKAVELASDEIKADYKEQASKEMGSLAKALISTRATNFGNHPSDSNLKGLTNDYGTMIRMAITFIIKIKAAYDSAEIAEYAAAQINQAAVKASTAADKAYGPDLSDKNKFAYSTWLDKQSNCATMINFALGIANKESNFNTYFDNFNEINKKIISSCSYKFNPGGVYEYIVDTSLTNEAKQFREKTVAEARAKRDEKIKKIKDAEEKKLQEARDAYWAEHKEEKEALEREKSALSEKAGQLKTSIDSLPERVRVAQLREEASSIRRERDGLGAFKGKEKKALEERLASVEQTMRLADDALSRAIAPLDSELTTLNKRVREINAELSKDR